MSRRSRVRANGRVGAWVGTSAASAIAALVGALGTDPTSSWYRRLAKPRWQLPPIAFPVVWTPLYVLIGYGTGRLLDAEPDNDRRSRLRALVAADLVVNAGWCWAFFKAKSPAAGLATLAVLDGLNLKLLDEARKRDATAARSLMPYVAWSLFATALNADIWRRNRRARSVRRSVT